MRVILPALMLQIAITPHIVLAQNAAWVNSSGGFYDEANNWVPNAVPGAGNDVLINVAGAYNIGFLADHTADTLSISNNIDLTFSSGGPGTTERTFNLADDATIDRATLTLGDLTQGRLLHFDVDGQLNMTGANLGVLNGAQLDTLPTIASSNTIEGAGGVASQVLVSGTDGAGRASRWASGGDINVGRGGGPASLTVDQGGQVSSIGGVTVGNAVGADGSLLTVRGTSADGTPSSLTSGFFHLGFLGGGGISTATARVADGAQVTTDGVHVSLDSDMIIEGEDSSQNPSRWDAGTFDVSTGFLNVLGGGHFTSGSATLNRVSIARVNGVGANGRPSRWDIVGNLTLGNDDGGNIFIDSGHVTSHTAQIGEGTGSSLLSVEGVPEVHGVWENSGHAFVGGSTTGPEASGDLRLSDNESRIDIGGTLTVWGPGKVRIDGGELEADIIDHTHGGAFEFNAGTLRANRFDGALLNVGGRLTPGVDSETGATLIDGNYTQQSSGTLAFDIGGTGPGSTYDLMNITGNAQVDGLLELSLVGGFTPDASNNFTLLVADDLVGFFDNVNTGQRLDTIDGRGSFIVNYGIGSAFDENRIVLSDFEASLSTPGDHDGDGDVDGSDFLDWQRNPSLGGLSEWQNNYGSHGGPLVAVATVPEPATLVLLMLFAAAVTLGKRQSR